MRNFRDTFETRKRSFISASSICMTVPVIVPLSISMINYHGKEVIIALVIMILFLKFKCRVYFGSCQTPIIEITSSDVCKQKTFSIWLNFIQNFKHAFKYHLISNEVGT